MTQVTQIQLKPNLCNPALSADEKYIKVYYYNKRFTGR